MRPGTVTVAPCCFRLARADVTVGIAVPATGAPAPAPASAPSPAAAALVKSVHSLGARPVWLSGVATSSHPDAGDQVWTQSLSQVCLLPDPLASSSI